MRLLISIVFLSMNVNLLGQEYNKYISGRLNLGSVIVHSQEVRSIDNSYPIGFELDLGKHKNSEAVWNNCKCYPKTGYSISFWDFDNPDVLGYGLTTMYYVQPVFGASKKFSFSVRGAAGLSFKSNPYDKEENPDNLSYSTYIAVSLQLGLAAHYRIADQWSVDLNTVFNHISNGGLQEPNKGINWPTIGLGISRYLKSPSFPDRELNDWRKDNDLKRWDISTFGTYHQPRPGLFYLSGGLEVKYAQRVSRLSNLTGGAEWMYDHGQVMIAEQEGVNGNNFGLGIGHEFILGRFLFGQQFSAYLIKPETQASDLYQRYSLVYRITSRINSGVSLKAHGHVADFADIRIGWNF